MPLLDLVFSKWHCPFVTAARYCLRLLVHFHFRLADLVDPPRIVHDLSWVSNHWPADVPVEDVQFVRPEVQRYCLMGAKDSYTDFHVDFGGTSIWYHILRVRSLLLRVAPF